MKEYECKCFEYLIMLDPFPYVIPSISDSAVSVDGQSEAVPKISEIDSIIADIVENDIESVAICFLNSYCALVGTAR